MKQQRVHLIDGMRGLSLFGILLANLLIFQFGIWGKDDLTLSPVDNGAYTFVKIFIEGSFMPIFTFLFGYSIVKMAESLKEKDLMVKRYFVRRFLFLILLGVLHGTFLWEGDILTFYGIFGFFLLLFINRKTKTILIWGLMMFVFTNAILLIGAGFASGVKSTDEFSASASYLEKANEIYATGTYTEIYQFRNNEDPLSDLPIALVFVIFTLSPIIMAPLFLFGMYAARVRLFTNPRDEGTSYLKATWILLPLGILMKGVGELAPINGWTDFLIGAGAPLLALGYISAFAYLYTKIANSIFMRAFESVGKLSLTNYIMQTVICTTIFYGYGLGLFGKLGVLNGIGLGTLIFVVQCIFSTIYLRYVPRGPLEFILRIWTNFSWNGHTKKKRTVTNIRPRSEF
ncbi:DUF418 domain-containing protein [Sporosarcina oncorhynchi]|uniref:DUF418 domain-containing protein n=1 Tax=Sporosarcina oncorhynchi TaxID=3056444 RepID=A0ABZ0L4K7_9BACL|nr:DUF418 domain-containing protein [Sporosarcina sp. T2O-4]WOV87428.1 DUF418 domain-containing protein [Sporosarcina sp. T2O-4]